MKRETLQKIFQFLFNTLTKVEFRGIEKVPMEGGVLLTTNHVSQMDTVLLFITPPRRDVTALVADKYQKWAFTRFIMNTGGIVWLDRSKADFGALSVAAEVLKSGRALGIAPEGTRSNGQLLPGKPGAALIAARTGVPVVPVSVVGTKDGIRRALLLQRPHVVVTFGAPYHLPPLNENDRKGSLQRATDEVMCRIAAQLPEEMRGVYKDHPRLKELLAAG